ncbi:MAG: bifunctional riboflavin kinase/FAD synthetase [Sediminibacterium sp.]|nr:bifunctional riboflavin kinase/FAD synthetase [Sediminibacterium sp.]
MKIYNSISQAEFSQPTIISVGNFDGMHIAHIKILEKMNELKEKYNAEIIIISFPENPRNIISPQQNNTPLLSSAAEKIAFLKEFGVDHLFLITNFYEFFSIAADIFVKDILIEKCCAKGIVMGFNHRFGKNQQGNFKLIEDWCKPFHIDVCHLDPVYIGDQVVSSSAIRKYLLNYELENAFLLLGRRYQLKGTVVEGMKIGRTLGFPTANIIPLEPLKLVPANGVYAVKIKVLNPEKWFLGMMNIGFRPTLAGFNKVLEVHIINFSEDLYGQVIEIEFYHFIRLEKKFKNLQELKEQLEKDQATVFDYFGVNK